jgi:3-oxoacyl-[acyl-carrier protein] reductase
MIDLKGKTAFVAGGARDIGSAICVELARCGAAVAFSYCASKDDAEKTAAAVQSAGGKVFSGKMDGTNSDSVNAFVADAAQQLGGGFDIVVNVIGGLVARKKIHEMDDAFWMHVIDLNLHSTFRVTKAALPLLRDGGAIVNFSSQAGRDGGGPGSLAYASSKGAVMTFTRGLAKELAPRKIRVNGVCPGMIDTTFHDTFTAPEVRQRVASMTPVGREGQPEDVAKLVVFLASDAACFVNGANIDINGGILFS